MGLVKLYGQMEESLSEALRMMIQMVDAQYFIPQEWLF